MDWIDKISITVIAVLSLVTIGMVTNNEIEKFQQKGALPPLGETVKSSATAPVDNDAKLYEQIKSLQAAGRYTDALSQLEEIVKLHPNNSQSFVYLAQLSVIVGDTNRALQGYRTAVEMEPDYVDKKTARFIGREIKKIVTENQPKIVKQIEGNPDDKDAKKALKNVFYLQRRLAGGCE